MYNEKNKTSLFRTILVGMFLVIFSFTGVNAQTDLRLTDDNPMAMPAVGSYGLRILSPTMLEITLIHTKPKEASTVSEWNFVSNGSLAAPSASEFAVTANNQSIGVQAVGFKRRPLYAPLNTRDLRIQSQIYLRLNSPIADGQTVSVTNPSGKLWTGTRDYTATANPLRFNPAIHVNGEGYMPNYVKKAMIGYYLGNLGELSIPASGGFKIVSVSNGAVVHTGSLTLRKDTGYSYSPTPYQQVYEADFSTFKTPGEYQLQVPGMGASFAFMIDEGIAATFARGYGLGLYHQRCGHSNTYPFSRHEKGACHRTTVLVPDMSFSAVNSTLANVTGDYAASQSGAPQLKDVASSLYPFVNKTAFDASGGHHDAGDYSKYTINVAQLANSLMFAVDSYEGVAALDNLGLPESGDGISDVMQTAKWELDFLAKLQDADGGFYFLVYPKDRRYEDTVSLQGTDLGDQQVVFPKTTAATAASVAALAQAASSPTFKAAYPAEAAAYLAKAKKGWAFLEAAWTKYGREGAYQKITHYGNEFRDRDEIAWAACELFLATGEAKYHTELTSRFDPADPNTRRWSWWRLFESYGAAVRSYSFAARSGRLPASSLNAAYLAKCDAEIIAAGDDQVKYVKDSAYANPFPTWHKPYRSAGWFMSVEQAYDVATAYQLSPKQDYIDALIGAINYEAGCNPLNMGFMTGVGWKRQRETVNQYAALDRRVLPPSGIPIGSVWPGEPTIWQYGAELNSLVYPTDSTSSNEMFAPYEKWTDTFNVSTEMVNPQQARGLGATAWLMARTSIKTQSWKSATGTITGLPASVPAQQNITIGLTAPGLDLSNATIVWEARDQEPTPASEFTFAAKNTGPQWVEAEALLPDGRRVFAKAEFNATTATNTPPNDTQSAPLAVSQDMVALYHLDNSLADATGKQNALSKAANAAFDESNLGWMAARSGANLHFLDLGDQASVAIPFADTWASDTQAIVVEAMIYVNAFKGYNKGNATLFALERNWNAYMELREDMYAGPVFKLGNNTTIPSGQVSPALTRNVWHHLRMRIDKTGYTVKLNGVTLATVASADLNNWNVNGPATLKFGNFDGWIDEVVVRHVRTSYPEDGGGTPPGNTPPSVTLTSPSNGAALTAGNSINLNATATDANGTVSKVEFYQGSTKLGEDTTAPYSFAWASVPAGNYSVTAKATDNAGATTTSSAASITVSNATVPTVATPVFSPNGGTYTNSVAVTLSSSTTGATVRYTTDGSNPTSISSVYAAPLTLSSSTTVKAVAILNGTSSTVSTATFTIVSGNSGGGETPVNGTTATFVQTDTTTRGTWKGVYGAEGFNVVNDTAQYPSYAQVTTAGKADWTWQWSTTDVKGLLKANSSTERILALWYSATSFTVDVNITDNKAHRMSLYFVDWDNLNRAQTVEIIDAETGSVLNTQSLSAFNGGKYLTWDISGKVKIRVTRTSGSNAVLNGMFFDAAQTQTPPSNQAPTVTLTSPSHGASFVAGTNVSLTATAADADGTVSKVEFLNGTTKLGEDTTAPFSFTWNNVTEGTHNITARATDNTGTTTTSTAVSVTVTTPAVVIANKAVFVKADISTRGNWKGVYGSEGYTIIGDATKAPAFGQVSSNGITESILEESTTDSNALQKANANDRILGVWYATEKFTVDVNITDGKAHRMSLYFYDSGKRGRTQSVEILDPATGAVLSVRNIKNFSNGRYLTWNISGNVRVRVTRTGPSNAILNGIFFDAPSNTLSTLSIPNAESLVGNEFTVELDGEVGSTYVVQRSSDMMKWETISTNVVAESPFKVVDTRGTGTSYFYRAVPVQ